MASKSRTETEIQAMLARNIVYAAKAPKATTEQQRSLGILREPKPISPAPIAPTSAPVAQL